MTAKRLVHRLIDTFRSSGRDRDLAREISSHIALLEDQFLRGGMSVDAARAEARRALGSTALTMDLHRDARSFRWIDDLRWDVAYAARLLRRSPVFAATAVVSLAVGIGANTTIFTVANALLFRAPAGVADPDRLVDIGRTVRRGDAFNPGSYPDYLDVRARTTTLEGVYASPMSPHGVGFAVDDASTEQIFAMPVSTNYFSVLGVAPAAGRLFGPADSEAPGASPVAVLSHRFWTRRFNTDAAVVGRRVRIDGRPFTIVGVASEGFQGTGVRASDVWFPITMTADGGGTSILTNRAAAAIVMGARLKAAATAGAAAAEIESIGVALAREHPDEDGGKGLRLLRASPVGGNAEPIAVFLALLMGIVTAVLLVACANVAGVLLARATSRRREIAVRVAIGAGRARLVRQLITETLLLFAIGEAAGLLLARVLTSAVVAALPALPFPIEIDLALDGRGVAFTTALSFAAALACGLLPAFKASRSGGIAGLRGDDAGPAGKARIRHAFLVAQIAFSIVLVVVAGLFARALDHVNARNPGFDASGVEIAPVDFATAGYTESTAPVFAHDVVEHVRRLPGVVDATIAAALPSGFERLSLATLQAADESTPAVGAADWNIVEPGYFSTLRMTMLSGRDFSAADRSRTQPVAIIGAGAARRFFPGHDAVGRYLMEQRVGTMPAHSDAKHLLVVGVVADPTYGTLFDGMTGVYIYVPLQQAYRAGFTNIVSRSATGRSVANDIRGLIRSMNPNVPVGTARPARDVTSLGLMPQRVVAAVAGSLGIVGLLLAAIGIYGATAYAVARRTREFGVRIALGATKTDILTMVLRQGVGLTIGGSIVGLLLAGGVAHLTASLLFGVPPIDPPTFAAAAALFVAVGLAACYTPARRATRIAAADALRHE